MNISINNNYSALQNVKLRQTATNPNSVSDGSQEELAFKGKLGSKKLFTSLTALSAAALGILGVKKKEQEQEVLTTPETTPETTILDKIIKAEQEDPEFFKTMREQVHYVGRDEDIEAHNYSDETIYVISQYKKEAPEFAYDLAQLSKTDSRRLIDEEETEYLAKNLKENSELVQKLKYEGNPVSTIGMLKLHEEHPEEVDGLVEINKLRTKRDKFYPDDIKKLIDSYKLDPEACKELATWMHPGDYSRNLFQASQIIRLTPEFKENKDVIIELHDKLFFGTDSTPLGETISKLFGAYKKSPEAVNSVRRLVDLDSIDKAVDLYNQPSGAKYFEILKVEAPLFLYRCMNTADRLKFVENSIKNDKFLTDLETQVPDIHEEFDVSGISYLNNLSVDDKKNVYRMIEDGRLSEKDIIIIKKIEELLPVYAQHPDTKVTDKMIERFDDPLARAMGL